MNIYLDIDGTLLTKHGEPANHLFEFLDYIVNNHEAYWLTTHCKDDANRAVEHMTMNNILPAETISLLTKIRPTNFNTLKTDAINFDQEFLWLDDYIPTSEQNVLSAHNAESRGLIVNLKENPNELKDILDWLKSRP